MVTIKENTIMMTKGDTLKTYVAIVGANGAEYKAQEADVIRFALKRNFSDSDYVIWKIIPSNSQILQLTPEDTKQLDTDCVYVYDIQITFGNGDVYTFISGKLKVKETIIKPPHIDRSQREEYEYYSGDYNITPKADLRIVLKTTGKLMTGDVIIEKVPYYEVSNESGETVYIASEVM